MYWTEKWPAWGPYAVEENRECLLSRGPLATKERVLGGEILMRLPNATLKAPFAGLSVGKRPAAVSPDRSQGGRAWAQLQLVGSFLGKECSLVKEVEGVFEESIILLGMNCLRAADCDLAE